MLFLICLLRGAERVFTPSEARAKRWRMERGGKKPRGHGLGQRNTSPHYTNIQRQDTK